MTEETYYQTFSDYTFAGFSPDQSLYYTKSILKLNRELNSNLQNYEEFRFQPARLSEFLQDSELVPFLAFKRNSRARMGKVLPSL